MEQAESSTEQAEAAEKEKADVEEEDVEEWLTEERLEWLAEFLQCAPVLWRSNHSVPCNKKSRRGLAYARLMDALGAGELGLCEARQTRARTLCHNFFVMLRQKLRWAAHQSAARGGGPERALALCPAWARRAEGYLQLLHGYCKQKEKSASTAPQAKKSKTTENTNTEKRTGDNNSKVRPTYRLSPSCDTAAGQRLLRRVVRGMRRAAPRHRGLTRQAAAAVADTLADTEEHVYTLWSSMRSLAMTKLRTLVTRGDVPPLNPSARLSARDWAVADLLLMHDCSILSDSNFQQYEQLRALLATFHLVQRFRLEPESGEERHVPPQTWHAAARWYSRSRVVMSAVALQLRWHSLKLDTRCRLRAHLRGQTSSLPVVLPLHHAVARRYPHVVTAPTLEPWRALVAQGKVAAPTSARGPAPDKAGAARPPRDPDSSTDSDNAGAEDDDDLIIVEKNIETIDLSDVEETGERTQKKTVKRSKSNDMPILDDVPDSADDIGKDNESHVESTGINNRSDSSDGSDKTIDLNKKILDGKSNSEDVSKNPKTVVRNWFTKTVVLGKQTVVQKSNNVPADDGSKNDKNVSKNDSDTTSDFNKKIDKISNSAPVHDVSKKVNKKVSSNSFDKNIDFNKEIIDADASSPQVDVLDELQDLDACDMEMTVLIDSEEEDIKCNSDINVGELDKDTDATKILKKNSDSNVCQSPDNLLQDEEHLNDGKKITKCNLEDKAKTVRNDHNYDKKMKLSSNVEESCNTERSHNPKTKSAENSRIQNIVTAEKCNLECENVNKVDGNNESHNSIYFQAQQRLRRDSSNSSEGNLVIDHKDEIDIENDGNSHYGMKVSTHDANVKSIEMEILHDRGKSTSSSSKSNVIQKNDETNEKNYDITDKPNIKEFDININKNSNKNAKLLLQQMLISDEVEQLNALKVDVTKVAKVYENKKKAPVGLSTYKRQTESVKDLVNALHIQQHAKNIVSEIEDKDNSNSAEADMSHPSSSNCIDAVQEGGVGTEGAEVDFDPKLLMVPIVTLKRIDDYIIFKRALARLSLLRRSPSLRVPSPISSEKSVISSQSFYEKNKELLKKCKPCSVIVKRLELGSQCGSERGGASRVAKRVELPDIEEVRRNNKSMLTAQVAPLSQRHESGSSPSLTSSEEEWTPDAEELAPPAGGGGAPRARTDTHAPDTHAPDTHASDTRLPTDTNLQQLLDELAEYQVGARRCTHETPSIASSASALERCARCAARLLAAPPADAAEARLQRRLLKHHTALAQERHRVKKMVKKKARAPPSPPPRPSPPPSPNPERDAREWLRQKNIVAEKFGVKPRCLKRGAPADCPPAPPAAPPATPAAPPATPPPPLPAAALHGAPLRLDDVAKVANLRLIVKDPAGGSKVVPLTEENLMLHAQPVGKATPAIFNADAVADINKKLGALVDDPPAPKAGFDPIITCVQSLAPHRPRIKIVPPPRPTIAPPKPHTTTPANSCPSFHVVNASGADGKFTQKFVTIPAQNRSQTILPRAPVPATTPQQNDVGAAPVYVSAGGRDPSLPRVVGVSGMHVQGDSEAGLHLIVSQNALRNVPNNQNRNVVVSGNVTQNGNLVQNGNAIQTSNLVQNGNDIRTGNLVHTGNTIQPGNLVHTGNAIQTGNLLHSGNAIQTENLVHTANLIQNGNVIQTGNLVQNGNVIQTANLIQNGNVIQTGNLVQNGNVIQTGNLVHTGNVIQTGNLVHTGNVIQTGNLVHTWNVTQTGNIITGNVIQTQKQNDQGLLNRPVLNTLQVNSVKAGPPQGGTFVITSMHGQRPNRFVLSTAQSKLAGDPLSCTKTMVLSSMINPQNNLVISTVPGQIPMVVRSVQAGPAPAPLAPQPGPAAVRAAAGDSSVVVPGHSSAPSSGSEVNEPTTSVSAGDPDQDPVMLKLDNRALPVPSYQWVQGQDPTNLSVLMAGVQAWVLQRQYLVVSEQQPPPARGTVFALNPRVRLILPDDNDEMASKRRKLAPKPDEAAKPEEGVKKPPWLRVKSFARIVGEAPEGPEVPKAPEGPEVPKAPEAPEAAQAPKAPEAPEVDDVVLGAPPRVYLDDKVYEKLSCDPLIYAKLVVAVPNAHAGRALLLSEAPLQLYCLRSCKLYPLHAESKGEVSRVTLSGDEAASAALLAMAQQLAQLPENQESTASRGGAKHAAPAQQRGSAPPALQRGSVTPAPPATIVRIAPAAPAPVTADNHSETPNTRPEASPSRAAAKPAYKRHPAGVAAGGPRRPGLFQPRLLNLDVANGHKPDTTGAQQTYHLLLNAPASASAPRIAPSPAPAPAPAPAAAPASVPLAPAPKLRAIAPAPAASDVIDLLSSDEE